MSMKLGAIVASLESALSESGALGATEDALKSEQTAMDVAEGNSEFVKDAAEIDYTDVAIEDAFAAEGEVENLLDAAEETLAEGGMSDKEAKLLDVSLESILSTIGMSPKQTNQVQSPVLSQESYQSEVTRRSATISTIESLKDTLKTVGKSIISALKAALDTVVGFIAKLLSNRALMVKHITNLQGRAAAIDTSKQKKAEEKFKGGAAALSVAGKASVATAKSILKDAGDFVSASSTIASAVSASKSAEDSVGVVRSALRNGMHATGGRVLKVAAADGDVSIAFEDTKTAEEIEAPSKEQMVELLKQAARVLDNLREMEKTRTKFNDGVKAIIARLSELASVARSKVGSAESKEKADEAAKAKKQARLARSVLSKAGGSLPSASFAAVKAVADYCGQGIRNYKAEPEKK